MLLIRVGLLAVVCAAGMQTVVAQEAFQEMRPDSAAPTSSVTGGTTEESDFSQGGFFGLGAQKPMKRVRGINLPEQQSKMGFSTIQQTHAQTSPTDLVPLARRFSKPEVSATTTDFPARVIYLNGRNISSVREQQLEGVNVSIDSHGNIHISAPHYEVQESAHYRPLFGKDLPRFNKPLPPSSNLGSQMSVPEAASVPSQPEIPVPPISVEETGKAE